MAGTPQKAVCQVENRKICFPLQLRLGSQANVDGSLLAELPEVSPAMLTHPVEVSFSVSFFSSNYGYWTTAKPELLLLKVDFATLLVQIDLNLNSMDKDQLPKHTWRR